MLFYSWNSWNTTGLREYKFINDDSFVTKNLFQLDHNNQWHVKMLRNALLAALLTCGAVRSQSNKDLYNGQFVDPQFYDNRQGSRESSRMPSPGDSDYRTYVYNNRRYGTDPSRYNPYNPSINQPGGFPYNPLNTNPLDDQYKYNTVSCSLLYFVQRLALCC